LENYLDNHVWIQVEEAQLANEVSRAKANHEQALQRLIEDSGISGEMVIHHLHGKPDDKIPECVDETEIDVLVMGTLARTGISGFVIGNTAENILQSINCSLVAMKPEGFVSPIK
jgi:nucleotide-binding universal stress UspA family protein